MIVMAMFEGSEFHLKGGIFVILPLVKGVEWHKVRFAGQQTQP